MRRRATGTRTSRGTLTRAIRYLGRYRREAAMAYLALIVATLSQLAVPQLTQQILDIVSRGFQARQVLSLPAGLQALAAQQL
ncbi:MAG TPA: hypothetical protein VFI11_13085, partial [Anaerolineales bacterium]|nr:hypothetical protein [Anaerolineales bacterium]